MLFKKKVYQKNIYTYIYINNLMAQIIERLSEEELAIKPKEELLKLINLLYNKIEERPKTSESQLKAVKNYYKKKTEYVCEMKKKYYEKMKQNPEWVERQRQINKEKYNKKKLHMQENN
jgi:DNA mismatch repair ATPase MutS